MSSFEKLTCKEEKAIEELQMRMKDALPPAMLEEGTLLYYRFLKARDFDVDKAEKMLRKNLLWRKIHQIDTILEDFKPSEVFKNYVLPSTIVYDKEGNIVKYSPAGKIDPHDVVKCFPSNSNYMKHWYWFAQNTLNEIREEKAKTGKKGYQCTMILDCDKLTFAAVTSRVTLDMFLHFINEVQDNYPERMKNTFAINAPPYLVLIYNVLKTVMSSAMLKKIYIFGNSGWKEKLLEVIDADVLPAFLGGNRTDPDGNPMCHSIVNHGRPIPACYFLSKKDKYFKDPDMVENLTIPPTNREEVNVEINNIGSIIQWEFLVKGKDIGFGLFLQKSERKMTEVIPVHKYSTPEGTEKDFHKCRCTGNYIIVFDNSYSWMSSKEVQFCINVLNPE